MAERLSRRQKRELGLLPRHVLQRARQLAKDGDITKDMTTKEMAFIIAADAADSDEFCGAWGNVVNGTYGVDWDSLIVFIERLMELLLKFLPLFI